MKVHIGPDKPGFSEAGPTMTSQMDVKKAPSGPARILGNFLQDSLNVTFQQQMLMCSQY